MPIDPDNPVVALCAAGMAIEGTPAEAVALFERAWAARTDDFDASIAAHYLARHQPTPEDTLRWNALALEHASSVSDGRADELLPSLHLNLADSLAAVGRVAEARIVAQRARTSLAALPADGYRDFLDAGIRRLDERLRAIAAEPSE